jgi:predicted transcriptional regulator of viral defense system
VKIELKNFIHHIVQPFLLKQIENQFLTKISLFFHSLREKIYIKYTLVKICYIIYTFIHLFYENLIMKYIKDMPLAGLGKLERVYLSALLRDTKAIITSSQAAEIWQLTKVQAAKRLAWYSKKGWLERIRQGVYIPVPLASLTSNVVPEEPFAIAANLFSPCYIGGVNAANYWNLTEQLFRTVTVMTEKMIQNRKPIIAGTEYILHTLKPRYFFGLKTIWLGGVKVKMSDPTRTLVDMLMFPEFCGGIRFIVDVLENYFKSNMKNVDQFIEYLNKAQNGAAMKRLGFLLELNFSDEQKLMAWCAQNLTTGYAKLNPAQRCEKLVTQWRLWVPENWKEQWND